MNPLFETNPLNINFINIIINKNNHYLFIDNEYNHGEGLGQFLIQNIIMYVSDEYDGRYKIYYDTYRDEYYGFSKCEMELTTPDFIITFEFFV